MSRSKYEYFWAHIGKEKNWEDNELKPLVTTINNSFKFDTHINNICTKANEKLSGLSRIRNILNFEQKSIIFKSFFESQCQYCPLLWMSCSSFVYIII